MDSEGGLGNGRVGRRNVAEILDMFRHLKVFRGCSFPKRGWVMTVFIVRIDCNEQYIKTRNEDYVLGSLINMLT